MALQRRGRRRGRGLRLQPGAGDRTGVAPALPQHRAPQLGAGGVQQRRPCARVLNRQPPCGGALREPQAPPGCVAASPSMLSVAASLLLHSSSMPDGVLCSHLRARHL